MFDYTTSHTPQLNGVIERIFEVVKEVALAMILNAKFNDTAQKMLWSEAVHTYKKVWKYRQYKDPVWKFLWGETKYYLFIIRV